MDAPSHWVPAWITVPFVKLKTGYEPPEPPPPLPKPLTAILGVPLINFIKKLDVETVPVVIRPPEKLSP
jgi:hypothetical protein